MQSSPKDSIANKLARLCHVPLPTYVFMASNPLPELGLSKAIPPGVKKCRNITMAMRNPRSLAVVYEPIPEYYAGFLRR